jgi:hypothetical protein
MLGCKRAAGDVQRVFPGEGLAAPNRMPSSDRCGLLTGVQLP